MEFSGRVYFDFASPDVFRLYRLFSEARREGAVLTLEWRAFSTREDGGDRPALAASELVRVALPEKHGKFVRAMIAAVHLEGSDPTDPSTVAVAAKAAGVPIEVVSAAEIAARGEGLLEGTVAEATELGVADVPTIYRLGPVVYIRTTPAVLSGAASERLDLIDRMLEDDGIWELTKP
jgi:predicted DsbA family dithiol-disulfide isomerase